MNRTARWTTLILLATLAVVGGAWWGDVRATPTVIIIAHPGVAIDTLALDDLQLIYLGKRERWGDGSRVHPAMLKTDDLHETFVLDYLGRSPEKFKTHWKQLVFTGRGIPPKSFGGEDELVAYVKATEGGIGYVSGGANVEGVHTIVVE